MHHSYAQRTTFQAIFSATVVVSSLGYFVDIYDLVLFSIIRVPSLKSMGISGPALLDTGIYLLNVQMVGMLIGGLTWGVLGDKKGRLSVLIGSILLYSTANIANGFAQNVQQYAIMRFIAGIGLAGELGAGVTLVSELLPKEIRGYGTALITAVGMAGALLAWAISQQFGWQTCYFIGGGLGFALLILRYGALESHMFHDMSNKGVQRGHFQALFTNRKRFVKYLRCILTGVVTWYLIGILMTFSPEFAKAFGVQGAVTGGESIFWYYLGQVLGDIISGFSSQILRTRKKVLMALYIGVGVMVAVYLTQSGTTTTGFYAICSLIGVMNGYWALYVTVAAEQFGTNLRATVATTVPNFVRFALVPIALGFQSLKEMFAKSYPADTALIYAAAVVGAIVLAISITALSGLKDTFAKDLDYMET
jgi:putative MFS transporter